MLFFRCISGKYNYGRKCDNNARNILKIPRRNIKFSNAQRAKLSFYTKIKPLESHLYLLLAVLFLDTFSRLTSVASEIKAPREISLGSFETLFPKVY